MAYCHGGRLKNQWAMDFDYLEDLETDDLEFLGAFCQLWYNGAPNKASGICSINRHIAKESYHRDYAARNDVLNQCTVYELIPTDLPDIISEDLIIDLIDRKAVKQS